MINRCSPILASTDVVASVRFYEDVLGFDSSWLWGTPPSFAGASMGNCMIMFNLQPELAGRVEGHQISFDVEDVNGLYARHLEQGAKIVSDIENKPWGIREYTVQDPSGYHLRFGGPPLYEPKGTGVFPEGVTVVRRMPTAEEHARVAGAAFYREGIPEGVLERTWKGVVAESPEGEVIGTVRIMYDAPGWFSVWDVAVVPEWQGKRIGTAMMEAAKEIVHEESPGAFIFLFTFKDQFYERMGYAKQSAHMRKV